MRFMDHPNVIKLYEVYETSKYVHLMLQLMEGGELFERIRRKQLYKESDAVPIMKNFITALAYLHQHQIVHRDLKPENLIFESNGDNSDIKIADFGLATKLRSPDELLT